MFNSISVQILLAGSLNSEYPERLYLAWSQDTRHHVQGIEGSGSSIHGRDQVSIPRTALPKQADEVLAISLIKWILVFDIVVTSLQFIFNIDIKFDSRLET